MSHINHYPEEDTPMSRAIETAVAIQGLKVTVENLVEKVDGGFSRNDIAMAKVTALLDVHDRHLTDLQRREERNRAIVKWVSGVAATVVAALVLLFFKR